MNRVIECLLHCGHSLHFVSILVLVVSGFHARSQQIADSNFTFPIANPAYAQGAGPVITIDEAHFNFHTRDGRYYPFAKLLAADGYRVEAGMHAFSAESLEGTDILVIANALPDDGEWVLPARSAFTDTEVEELRQYIENGGSLLLIADHMPFPGAAENLAAAFGFTFVNGFAIPRKQREEVFSRANANLASTPVTEGRSPAERIDSVILFTGQGFLAPLEAKSFLLLDTSYTILLPERAWEFDANTPSLSAEGHVAGACMEYGKGRIVVMGEAAMFTAQLAGAQKQKIGMNHRKAKQNPQLLLNIIHWLDGHE